MKFFFDKINIFFILTISLFCISCVDFEVVDASIRRHDPVFLIEKIQEGDIHLGSSYEDLLDIRFGKPLRRSTLLDNGTGASYDLFAYYFEGKMLKIYICDNMIYAACLINLYNLDEGLEVWYFCDIRKLEKYILLGNGGMKTDKKL